MTERTLSKKEQRKQFLRVVALIVATMDAAEEWGVRLTSHLREVPNFANPDWVVNEATGDVTITIELKNVETERIRVKA